MGKGENAGYQHFLLFPQMFSQTFLLFQKHFKKIFFTSFLPGSLKLRLVHGRKGLKEHKGKHKGTYFPEKLPTRDGN